MKFLATGWHRTVLLFLFSPAALAAAGDGPAGLDYDYLELAHVVAGDIDDSAVFGGAGERSTEGYWLRGSRELTPHFFLRGDAVLLDVDTPDGGEAAADWHSVGTGARLSSTPGDRPLDLWAQVSADRIALAGEAYFGWGLTAGLRYGVADWLDFNAWYKRADADSDGDDFEATPTAYGLELSYRASSAVALTAGYAEGEFEVADRAAGQTARGDFDLVTVGLRLHY